jgi:hypothetical protein
VIQNPQGHIGHVALLSSHGHAFAADRVLPTQALRSRHMSAGIEASRRAWILSLPDEPPILVFWLNQVTRRFCSEPPQTPRADFSREPLPCIGSRPRLRLGFLATMRPHLTSPATRSLKPRLLVFPLLRGTVRHRPFTLALHLHQRKSSRNLHLQYSAKSQSTLRCQSLITARSDHPPVLRRSGPQACALLADRESFVCSSTRYF